MPMIQIYEDDFVNILHDALVEDHAMYVDKHDLRKVVSSVMDLFIEMGVVEEFYDED